MQRGALASLSADIPVPQCCPMRLATLAALAASEVRLATLWSFEVRLGLCKAEQGPFLMSSGNGGRGEPKLLLGSISQAKPSRARCSCQASGRRDTGFR